MLETKDLTIRFGGHVAVDHVSCSFAPGTLTVYVNCVARFARHFGKSPESLGPDEAVALAQDSLADAGIDAQCVVQEVSPRDHSVWEALVQHGIGLTL